MKQTLLSILLVLFSLIGCQTLDAVDTITVRPTEITVSPTTEATQATVSEPEATTAFVSIETEPTENGTLVETLPQETVPPETRPVFTEPATEPTETVETQPPETEPASTEPDQTDPQLEETKPVETEPTEPETEPTEPAPTEPTECQHDWTCIHHTEEGHWVAGVACSCGWTVYGDSAQLVSLWNTHSASYPAMESLLYHGGYGSIDSWVVDKPAYDEWVCSHCGSPKP